MCDFDKRFVCPRCGGGCSEEVVWADWRWFAAFWALSCAAIFAFRYDDMRALRSAYWMHGRCQECGRWIGGE